MLFICLRVFLEWMSAPTAPARAVSAAISAVMFSGVHALMGRSPHTG